MTGQKQKRTGTPKPTNSGSRPRTQPPRDGARPTGRRPGPSASDRRGGPQESAPRRRTGSPRKPVPEFQPGENPDSPRVTRSSRTAASQRGRSQETEREGKRPARSARGGPSSRAPIPGTRPAGGRPRGPARPRVVEEPEVEQEVVLGEPVRLQKYLSMAGMASRRYAEELIAEGLVTVNGAVVTKMGTLVTPGRDTVALDGRVIDSPVDRKLVYFAYHKPRGVLVTASDPEGRLTIYEHIRDLPPGVIPVGRLDRNSEGLLLLTNDGELAHRLMHPKFEVIKEYEVIVEGLMTDEDIREMQEGMDIGDGPDRPTAPAEAEILQQVEGRTRMRIILSEGRKRQVRRMVEALGYEVKRLIRVREGIITLSGIRLGTTRKLTPQEVKQLKAEVGLR